MKKLFSVVLVVIALFAMTGMALAAESTSNFNVTANVAAVCTISNATNIDFGAYDPTNVDAKDATGNIDHTCTKGSAYKLFITGARQMTNGTDNLAFQLFTDNGRATAFPSAELEANGQVALNSNTISTTVYARIPALQDVGVGDYLQTLTATVTY